MGSSRVNRFTPKNIARSESQSSLRRLRIAAAHQIEYLLTWNCKHIANATMRGPIEGICRAAGLTPPIICTPEELPAGSSR